MADGNRPLALVTGASSGIGYELARQFAEHGYDVVIAADGAGIDDAAATLGSDFDVEVVPVQVDLATKEGVGKLDARVRELGRPLDAVAINAGVGVSGRFWETPLRDHLRLVDLNIASSVHLAGLVVPEMVSRGSGRILFTSSIAARMPGPYESTYGASKAFISSFAQALRVELADTGVSVTALMPGPTDTEFFERAGLEDTKLGHSKKDDRADVAREGLGALMNGEDHVVARSFRNKVQAAAGKVMPERVGAAAHARLSEP